MSNTRALNKKICKRCCNEFFKIQWTEYDDARWKKGLIECPYEFYFGGIKMPPKDCCYRLEHLMVTQEVSQ